MHTVNHIILEQNQDIVNHISLEHLFHNAKLSSKQSVADVQLFFEISNKFCAMLLETVKIMHGAEYPVSVPFIQNDN